MRDVWLAVGNLLGFGPRRSAKDNHPGPKARSGVVHERAGADQLSLRFQVVNKFMMKRSQLFARERKLWRRIDHLVVDHPALLAFAHGLLLAVLTVSQPARRLRRQTNAGRVCSTIGRSALALGRPADVVGAEHQLLHL